MGSMSRRKGQRGEREAAEALGALGLNARRRGQTSRYDGADLETPLAVHWEVKRVEALNLGAAMAQAHRDAFPGDVPCVLHRRSREPWRVTVNLEDLPRLAGVVAEALAVREHNARLLEAAAARVSEGTTADPGECAGLPPAQRAQHEKGGPQ